MSDAPQEQDIQMDADSLCREDIFTDNRVGTVRRLTPVTATGEDDASREVRYIGSTQIMTPAGARPTMRVSSRASPRSITPFPICAQGRKTS